MGIGIAQHQHNEFGEVLLRSYRNVTCSRQSEYLGQFHAPMEMAAQFRLRGGNDAWLVNGLDDNQQGLALYFMPSTDQAIASDQSRHLERLAKHLARGHRLHRKLIQEQCHPMADAKPSVASDHIREASRARCPSGIVGDASAVSPTFCAVEGIGLTLVHEAGPGGRHYTIARASTSGSHAVDRLTSRERQVAMLVLLGRTNKEIAYELQMAHATVRVLVARAGKKLGVGSREEFFKILIEDPYFARKHERCKPDGA
ncbi:MAG: response regulator transcription factor [Myxococcota bacterium]